MWTTIQKWVGFGTQTVTDAAPVFVQAADAVVRAGTNISPIPWREGVFRGGGGYVYQVSENAIRILSGPTGVGFKFERASAGAQRIAAELAALGWPGGTPAAPAAPAAAPASVLPPEPSTWQNIADFVGDHRWIVPAGVGVVAVGAALVYVVVARRQ